MAKKPDNFLGRIVKACGEQPRQFARNIGVEYEDFYPLLKGTRGQLPEMDRDEVWWKISEYVHKKIGNLMAVRNELTVALQKDRANRVARVERFKRYTEGV